MLFVAMDVRFDACACVFQVADPLDDQNFDFFDEDDNIPKFRGDDKLFRDF